MPVEFKLVLGLLLAGSALCGLIPLILRQALFPRRFIPKPEDLPKQNPGLEKHWLSTSSGRVEAWYLPPETGTGPAPVVISAHGNIELIDFWTGKMRTLTQLGLGVLLVEYPGYGRSQGQPTQKTITEAMTLAYDLVAARPDVDTSRIVLCGRSLGGAAVCILSTRRPSAAMILMSTFSSFKAIASEYFIPGFLVPDPFDNLAAVSAYTVPILLIHGKQDNLVKYEHALRLVRAAQHGTLISYTCQHRDCPPDWGVFWQDVERFLRQAGILKADFASSNGGQESEA
ncbi:MAG: alpha/beta hydrolase [bacterium]|nr:alpha/beta hydrolase [bacterium]